ncbi:MAG: hypothetical protein ACOYVE_03400 [Melioribacter sp.]|uniref:hypothetical protein n=1 Tax=Melioribacter sp. TaxID=2052167 RepID=UPI003BC3BC0E
MTDAGLNRSLRTSGASEANPKQNTVFARRSDEDGTTKQTQMITNEILPPAKGGTQYDNILSSSRGASKANDEANSYE